MKGTNSITVNHSQMVDICDKWFKGITYGDKDDVTDISLCDDGSFELTIEEAKKKNPDND